MQLGSQINILWAAEQLNKKPLGLRTIPGLTVESRGVTPQRENQRCQLS